MISKDGKFITNIGVRGLKDANKKDVYMNINIKELLKWENSGYESLKPAVMEKLKKAQRLEAYIFNEGTRPSGARQTAYYINICEDSIKNLRIQIFGVSAGELELDYLEGNGKFQEENPSPTKIWFLLITQMKQVKESLLQSLQVLQDLNN